MLSLSIAITKNCIKYGSILSQSNMAQFWTNLAQSNMANLQSMQIQMSIELEMQNWKINYDGFGNIKIKQINIFDGK